MTDLEKRLAALSPEQRKILLRRLNREATPNDSKEQTIPALVRDTNVFPLSFSQQRLWLLDQLGPGNAAYNIPTVIRFRGDLQVDALEKSISEIVCRHEALRTSFTVVDGKPMQVIHLPMPIALSVVDLSSLPATRIENEAAKRVAGESQRAFDLQQAPLLRTTLLKLSETEYIFLIIIHHIVSDAWSMVVFMQELQTLYQAFCNGQPVQLPALSIQYADFAHWQLQRVESGGIEAQLAYWKNKLALPISTVELATDRIRPTVQTFNGAKKLLTLGRPQTVAIKELGRRENATLFMVLLAVFKTLLYRYTGQMDMVVGSPIAGRNHGTLDNLIGSFINTLVLRTDLSGAPSFQEVLRRVREVSLEAFANQDVPFEKLLEELHPQRDLSRTPIFQVLFNMLNVGGETGKLLGLESEIVLNFEIDAKFDITLYVREESEQIEFILVYNRDLFDAHRMDEMLFQFEYLLHEIGAHPDRKITEYALPVAEQARQKQANIIERFNQLSNQFTEFADTEIHQSIADRFEQQVKKFPAQIAIRTRGYEWSYQFLNQMANRVAYAILKSCDDEQERAALLFNRDAPMVAGMLGALKAGKTYIPLDPHYPLQRLSYMLEDSQASVIITDNLQIELARSLVGDRIHLVNIDELAAPEDQGNPSLDIPPQKPAYILYTSGSTGQPKGVMQAHRNVLHFIRVYTNNLHIGAADKLSLLSSYSFDAAVMDIFGALLNGATLHPIDIKLEGLTNLVQYLNEYGITIYHSTPTVYRYFLNSLTATDTLQSVRLVVLGGEAVVRRDVVLYQRYFSPDCVFVNGLGPTESTIALQYFVDKETRITHNSVPVGYPVDNTEVIFLNDAGQETPIIGEIAIRSSHVALGYWNKDDITRTAFPSVAGQNGKRIYRTGDIGQLLPDGTIEFRGRKDFQVKIRGHRVEVGEVETKLAEHPMIKECVVTASDDGNGGQRLVAYFVDKGSQPSVGEIRQFVADKLPDYMIPAAFVHLHSFPMTPTGKIDRLALPQPNVENGSPLEQRVSARNTTEEELVKIWEDLLKIHPIGVKADFFELGGHSLMAAHMFTRINQKFNVNLPLATLFHEATIEYLSQVIDGQSKSNIWSSLITIEGAGNHAPFFCVHGLTGDILWFRELAQCLAPDYPFYGLQSRGLDGVQNPLERIEDMAAYYIEEIRRVQPKGPYYLGGASFGGSVALEMAQQLLAQGEQVSTLVIFDHAPPNISMDGENGGLKRRLIILKRVLKNFPHWLNDFLQIGPSRMLLRIRRKLRLIQKAKNKDRPDVRGQIGAEDLIDFAGELAPHRQHLITCNFHALRNYDPRPYPGDVLLFRALNRPLLNIYNPEIGWQKLTSSRVRTIDISSSHEGMFQKPYVEDLARKLRSCLDEDRLDLTRKNG